MKTAQFHSDDFFMNEAITEAEKAIASADIPIGAVIVLDNEIIARSHNEVEKQGSAIAHAEMIAIMQATKKLEYKHLLNATLYVTLEPCSMCAGAIVLARIQRVVFGAYDPKSGACGSVYNIINEPRLNHRCEITPGICEYECSAMLKQFFKTLRECK